METASPAARCCARKAERSTGDRRIQRRHHVRMVRLLPVRLARRQHQHAFLHRRERDDRLHPCARHLRRRLHRSPVRRAGLRPHRRHCRPQEYLPRHHDHHGHRHLHGRPAARRRHVRGDGAGPRHHSADPAGRAARAAGSRHWRRVWRRRDLHRRTRASGPSRLLHLVDPDHGDHRPVRLAAGHHGRTHEHVQGSVRRVGLAYSVPAVGGPAGRLDLDPPAAQRKPRLPQDEGRDRGSRKRRSPRRSASGRT